MKELFVLAIMVALGCLVQSACSHFIDEPNRVYKEAADDVKWLEENFTVVYTAQPSD